MENRLKVVIPMAGLGTRLRPHTWSKPKQLISLADSTVLGQVVNILKTLPPSMEYEFINIIGAMGDQIETFFKTNFPDIPAVFVNQEQPKGQSHAIAVAHSYLQGPMIMIFSDTLIETNLNSLANETADIVAWVTPVPDPRKFGIAQVDANGKIVKIVEKPNEIENNLAVTGCYYFNRSEDLLAAIDEQMSRNIQIKGEFYIADAINIMLEHGASARVQRVDVWLDAGTPETLLQANHYLLDHGHSNAQTYPPSDNVSIIPPVYIGPDVSIRESIIGPYVSVGAGCTFERSIISESIIEPKAQISSVMLSGSIVGCQAVVEGMPAVANIGDNCVIKI
jgi:glucose-1-phosphate thymidylyltransferase